MKYSKYLLYGSSGEDELSSVREANDVVYFGVSSFKIPSVMRNGLATSVAKEQTYTEGPVSGCIAYHIAAALLRMILFEELKIEIAHPDLPIPYFTNAGYIGTTGVLHEPGFRIDFVYHDSAQVTDTYKEANYANVDTAFKLYSNYDTVSGAQDGPNKSFRYMARELSRLLANNFIFQTGDPTAERNKPSRSLHGYYVTIPDIANHTSDQETYGRVLGYRTLHDRYFKAYSTAEISIQNVCPASGDVAGDVNDAGRVDSVPCEGKAYYFKTPFPRLKGNNLVALYTGSNTGGYTLQANAVTKILDYHQIQDVGYNKTNSYKLEMDINGDGMILPDDAMSRDLFQLPGKEYFQKLTRIEKMYMRPGGDRKYRLHFRYDGDINKWLKSLAVANVGPYTAGGVTYYNNHRIDVPHSSLGTSVLFGLERRMTNMSASLLRFNLSVNYYAGCYFKRRKATIMQPLRFDAFARDPDTLVVQEEARDDVTRTL